MLAYIRVLPTHEAKRSAQVSVPSRKWRVPGRGYVCSAYEFAEGDLAAGEGRRGYLRLLAMVMRVEVSKIAYG